MISKTELAAWVDALPDDAQVAIDDDGMDLQTRDGEHRIEVGALPEGESL